MNYKDTNGGYSSDNEYMTAGIQGVPGGTQQIYNMHTVIIQLGLMKHQYYMHHHRQQEMI